MVSVQQECVRKVAAVHTRLSPVISATRLSSTFVLEKKSESEYSTDESR